MQSKVFRDFLKKGFMNSKIIISISVIITIIVVVFSLTQNEIIQNQILPEINDFSLNYALFSNFIELSYVFLIKLYYIFIE